MRLPGLWQGLNNAVALDFDYRQQMIYWTDVTTQGSMIRRMYINGSDVQVSITAVKYAGNYFFVLKWKMKEWLPVRSEPPRHPLQNEITKIDKK